jgi:hypothetical protein
VRGLSLIRWQVRGAQSRRQPGRGNPEYGRWAGRAHYGL